MTSDRSRWEPVTELMEQRVAERRIEFGRYVSYWFDRTPRRALYSMSYYKFAAKMIGQGKRVLDVGCNEGLGTWLLAAECGFARGVDLDEEAIDVASGNWEDPRIEFACQDFLEADVGRWEAIVNFDVIEHIRPQNANAFLARVSAGLAHDGIAVIGTPSLEGQRYASAIPRAGHVNVYSGERLEDEMRQHFDHVFMFGANDEVVHTGFLPMAHYLLAVGCKPRAVRVPR
jgi:2-polyprenyl-3-methyl-5-hydroxy-6-metoxy-1,4-benzoquinol methylase